MVKAGSKGIFDNIKSVALCLGKQTIGNEEYPNNVKGRLSPHTVVGD